MSYTCYTIKVELDDDLRRLNFDRQPGADNGLSFAELESQIRELFDIPAFTKLRFTYVDCDDDVVTMVSDRDLRDASVSQGLNPLRMKVVPLEQKKQRNLLECTVEEEEEEENTQVYNSRETAVDVNQVHVGITCDGCHEAPLTGPRYRSTIKENYDICQSCYVKTDHYAGEYEVVDPPLPVDPVAEAQASMEALALQRIRHQGEIAIMRQQRYWAEVHASLAADAARAGISFVG
ncbi:hypothetical protein R1flu_004143 [Riccia fluitans]|uniref:ZZ-type domain-containing protein n=1 Tax=Riccia fluitans TaxID=41844 RepID=A0ABD1YSF6_9MARC